MPSTNDNQISLTCGSRVTLRVLVMTLLATNSPFCDAHLGMGARMLSGGKHGFAFKAWVPHANGVKVEIKDSKTDTMQRIDLIKRKEDGNENMWVGECAEAELGDDYRFCIDSSWNDCFEQEGETPRHLNLQIQCLSYILKSHVLWHLYDSFGKVFT